jgi:DNA-binding MarR family transcriptional regulator
MRPLKNAATVEVMLDTWVGAWRLRRAVERVLRRSKLSFPQWWVLYVTDQLIREGEDAVSQQAVARRTHLDKSTVSYLMTALAERGLVDRGPDPFNWMYRIWLSDEGSALLTASTTAVAGALKGET